MKLNLSLKKILIVTFILLSTLPILIVGFIALKYQSISIEREVTDKNILIAKTISDDLERFLFDSLSFLKQIAYVLENNNIITDKLDDYLLSIINNYEYFDIIRILDTNGIIKYNVPYDENFIGLDMSLQEYFIIPKRSNNIYWSKTFISAQTSYPTITLSLPFKYGVIVGHLNLSSLIKIVEKIRIGSTGFASIIDSDGTIIAHPDKTMVQERVNINEFYTVFNILTEKEKTFKYSYRNKNWISSAIIIPQTHWIVNVSQREDDAFYLVKNGSTIIIIGSFITILLSLIIGFVNLQISLKPLFQLTEDSQRFAEGDYTHNPKYTPYLEINTLINSFKIMSEAIKKRENELKNNRDHLEDLVKQRTLELESVNKDLESFSYSVSHDLRVPLRSLEGFSKILYEDYKNKLDKPVVDYIKKIINSSKKMSELINNILKLSQVTKQELNIKEINLSALVDKISNELANNEKNRDIKFKIANNIKVKADASLIEIAIFNLLSNAIKYTSKIKKAIIEFGIKTINSKKIFYIKDNGAGFDMKYINNLFLPFKRLHSEQEFSGSGIGLSIVKRIILKHDGRIWAESKEDSGTTFYFTLGKL